MLLLTTTASIIQVVTGAAGASIECHASWMDRDGAGTTFTPGSWNPPAITTATTIELVASPASGVARNVKNINITNVHPTVASPVTVIHTNGTSASDLMGVTLLPGENLIFTENGEWRHHDTQGGVYTYGGPPSSNLGMNGVLAETMPRETCPEVNTVAPTASGTLFMMAIYLKAGVLVSSISASSATTAAVTPTNYFFALYDGNRNLRAVSANQTTTAWAANTLKTLAMTTPYRVPTSGVYYIGVMMTATTLVTLKGGAAKTGGQLASLAPVLHGASSAGLTTAMPDPAAVITGGLVSIYAAVS